MYEIGKVYIWQNLSPHPYSHIQNGHECIVTGPPEYGENKAGEWIIAQPTDSIDHGEQMWALKGNLRPKNDPTGEKSVMDQFTQPINEKTPEMA